MVAVVGIGLAREGWLSDGAARSDRSTSGEGATARLFGVLAAMPLAVGCRAAGWWAGVTVLRWSFRPSASERMRVNQQPELVAAAHHKRRVGGRPSVSAGGPPSGRLAVRGCCRSTSLAAASRPLSAFRISSFASSRLSTRPPPRWLPLLRSPRPTSTRPSHSWMDSAPPRRTYSSSSRDRRISSANRQQRQPPHQHAGGTDEAEKTTTTRQATGSASMAE